MDAIKNETFVVEGVTYRLSLVPDDTAEDPRGSDGNVSVLVLNHKVYDLPCENEEVDEVMTDGLPRTGRPASFRALARWLKLTRGATVVLPVWGYDHSGLAIRAGERIGLFADPWDSGLLGVVFDDPAQRTAHLGEDTTPEQVREVLGAEVEQYDHWARGLYVGYVVEKLVPACEHGHPEQWVFEDSCGGIDDLDYAWSIGREAIGV